MLDDPQLLRRFVKERSQIAFTELVRKHVDLVHSAALRVVNGDRARAEDVCQEVFTTLARKAPLLTDHPVLVGWLHTTTRHAAMRLVRSEARRSLREEKAYIMDQANTSDGEEANWEGVKPLLDEALANLTDRDRDAVLLRYFERRPFSEVGACLRISEDAARMRVERALDKLRKALRRRGLTSTSAALGLVLTQQGVTAAPAGLVHAVGTAALSAATAGGLGFGGVLIFMSATKVTVAGGIVGALAVGIAVYQSHVAERAMQETTALHAQWSNLREQRSAVPQRANEEPSAAARPTPAAVAELAVSPAPTEDAFERLLRTDAQARDLYLRRSRAEMSLRYVPLFDQLNLSPEQRTLFLDGAVAYLQRQIMQPGGLSRMDPAKDQAVAGLLQAQFGEAAVRSYQEFERSAGARNLANEFVGRSYYTGDPWTRQQVDRLTELIKQASPSYRTTGNWNDTEVDWDDVLRQAKEMLTAKQFAAARSIAGMMKTGQMLHVAEIEARQAMVHP